MTKQHSSNFFHFSNTTPHTETGYAVHSWQKANAELANAT